MLCVGRKLATPENTKSYSPVPAFSVRVAQVRAAEHIQKSLPFDYAQDKYFLLLPSGILRIDSV